MCSLRIWLTILVPLVLVAGCRFGESSPKTVGERLEAPAAPGSAQPRLYAGTDGTVWLNWLEPADGDAHALRYATLDDAGWSAPTTVATGTDWFVNWADFPSVRPLPSGRVAAHYLQSNGPRGLAYAVRIAQSEDGSSWQEAVTPHEDGTPTEHGFVSLLPWHSDRLLALWLDGRKMTTGDGHGHGDMTLRSAVLDSTGAVKERALVDDRTCECCATSAVRVGNEALVAYRDRSQDEVRDIRLVRFDGEQWTEPTRLHDDGWRIEGCPVNGPALAAKAERVVAAWFTATGGIPRVKAAFSADGGRSFSDPVVVAEGETKGRVDAVLLDDGAAVVSWLGTDGDRGRVQLRSVRADSSLSPVTAMVTLPSAARSVGFPKVVRSGDHLYGAWVGPGGSSEGGTVQVARMAIRQLQ